MTRDLTIRRRSALSALGVIGLSSAGAGLGTTAFFSDEEAYENNELVAGELDLKIDWEEHYYRGDIVNDLDIVFSDPDGDSEYRPFPAGSTEETRGVHGVWVNEEDVPAFMAQTALEAYPDDNGDGLVEFPDSRIACEVLGDLDGALSEYTDGDPTTEQTGRTDNDDTRLSDGSAAPLVNLEDVKPGDFGEITFSTHLCDNDGYLWINAPDGFQEANNTTTEPEGEDADDTGADLAETVRTALWYDNNCNNLPDTTVEPLDLMVAVDTSDSIGPQQMEAVKQALNTFIAELPDNDVVEVGLLEFSGFQEGGSDPITVLAELGSPGRFGDGGSRAAPGTLLPDEGDGNTAMPGAIDLSSKILTSDGRQDTRKAIILVTDGQPNYIDFDDDGDDGVDYQVTHEGTTYTSDVFGNGGGLESTPQEKEETAEVTDSVPPEIYTIGISDQRRSDLNRFLQTRVASESENAYFTEFGADLPATAEQIVQDLVVRDGEEYIFRGLTLAEAMDYLTGNDGRGIPLDGDRLNGAFDELADPENASERQCFDASATSCFGFSWWVPVDHGNEIQSDGVTFDLGFYTEQCRRNDGAGLPPEVEESQQTANNSTSNSSA